MTTITLTTGLPASGKSTWALEQVKNSNGKIVRINLDDIRSMLWGDTPWTKELEQSALEVQDKAILAAVKMGKDVIVDNTHLNKTGPTRIKRLFDGEIEFKVQDFTDVPTITCFDRNEYRIAMGRPGVPREAITNMAKQLQKPWRLTAEFMNDIVLSPPLVYDPNLPWCVVFDTDGTTALHRRSPYNYAKANTDLPNRNIITTIEMLRGGGYYDLDGIEYEAIHTIGMSGRPATWRDLTENWYLDIAQMDYDEFHMRGEDLDNPEDDKRNDAEVKQEMVDKHIRGKYNVLVWFDDRDRVVRRLRKLGINVAQVNDGDF